MKKVIIAFFVLFLSSNAWAELPSEPHVPKIPKVPTVKTPVQPPKLSVKTTTHIPRPINYASTLGNRSFASTMKASVRQLPPSGRGKGIKQADRKKLISSSVVSNSDGAPVLIQKVQQPTKVLIIQKLQQPVYEPLTVLLPKRTSLPGASMIKITMTTREEKGIPPNSTVYSQQARSELRENSASIASRQQSIRKNAPKIKTTPAFNKPIVTNKPN